jgi:hypothetical protein
LPATVFTKFSAKRTESEEIEKRYRDLNENESNGGERLNHCSYDSNLGSKRY